MELDDLRRRAAEEPERHVTYPVYRSSEPLTVNSPGGIPLAEFLANRELTSETRTVTYRHLFGAPASFEAIDAWQKRWPSHPLPADLKRLVEQVNGIHLWADVEEDRAYSGLAPIEEWQPAHLAMYGPDAAPALISERYLALSYHADGGSYVVLDVGSGTYLLMDACWPDETCPIGSSVSELLDWLWESRIPPESGGV